MAVRIEDLLAVIRNVLSCTLIRIARKEANGANGKVLLVNKRLATNLFKVRAMTRCIVHGTMTRELARENRWPTLLEM